MVSTRFRKRFAAGRFVGLPPRRRVRSSLPTRGWPLRARKGFFPFLLSPFLCPFFWFLRGRSREPFRRSGSGPLVPSSGRPSPLIRANVLSLLIAVTGLLVHPISLCAESHRKVVLLPSAFVDQTESCFMAFAGSNRVIIVNRPQHVDVEQEWPAFLHAIHHAIAADVEFPSGTWTENLISDEDRVKAVPSSSRVTKIIIRAGFGGTPQFPHLFVIIWDVLLAGAKSYHEVPSHIERRALTCIDERQNKGVKLKTPCRR